MSVRQIVCPECNSNAVEVEHLEQDSREINVKARITCKSCEHVWEDKVSNPARKKFLQGSHVVTRTRVA